jgi:hypothetical protein
MLPPCDWPIENLPNRPTQRNDNTIVVRGTTTGMSIREGGRGRGEREMMGNARESGLIQERLAHGTEGIGNQFRNG